MVYIPKKKKKSTITVLETKSANEVQEWSLIQELLKQQKDVMSKQKNLTFTDETIKMIKGNPGINGRNGIDGRDGVDGNDGRPGKEGKSGYTPVKGTDYFDGKDGKDGMNGKDGKDGKDGEQGKPPKHEYKLGSLRFELPDGSWGAWIDLKQFATDLGGKTLHRGGANYTDGETPTGTINSSNVTFTLEQVPVDNSLRLFYNGSRLKQDDDYTLSSKTITMAYAPVTNSNFICDYRY